MSVVSPQRSSVSARLTEMPPRKLARITGIAWIITFVTSIPAVLLYDPLLNQRDFILGAGGGDTGIFIGATLELLLIIANIGTAVLPFALFRRYNEKLAVGFVTARLVEVDHDQNRHADQRLRGPARSRRAVHRRLGARPRLPGHEGRQPDGAPPCGARRSGSSTLRASSRPRPGSRPSPTRRSRAGRCPSRRTPGCTRSSTRT